MDAYFADLDVEFDFRPVHLRKLVQPAPGEEEPGSRPKLSKRKSTDYQNSVRHWSQLCDAPISPDALAFMKSDTSLALRAALVAKDEGRFRAFHDPMYRARWAEPRDPADPEVIHGLLSAAGLDADAALARAESDALCERLERDTDEAISRGVFGVPTIFVGDEMFWGNDRYELVRHQLTG
ncbi:MAG: thioredoxin domain-containing protein [bacterium]|nr:thioredoxin domain-containing protein [bacterium]